MGNYNGLKYSNSLEAFKKSYKSGYRNFETDLVVTNDYKIVLFHRYNKNIYSLFKIDKKDFSYNDFMSGKVFSNLDMSITPLDLKDLVDLMRKYKNLKIMLHIHSKNRPKITDFVLNELIKEIGDDKELYKKFSVGVNFPEELEILKNKKEIVNIHYYIRSREKRPKDLTEISDIINYLRDNNIKIVSIPIEVVLDNPDEVKKLKENNILIYSFASNDISKINMMHKLGVDIVGSDLLFKNKEADL